MTVLISVRFTAKDDHFPNGELRMECNAEIEGVWTAHIAGVALGGASGRASDRHPSEIRARDMENQGGLNTDAHVHCIPRTNMSQH